MLIFNSNSRRINIRSVILSLAATCFIIVFFYVKKCAECFTPSVMMIKFLLCGIVIFIGSIYSTLKFLKLEKLMFGIETQPLVKTDNAVEGVPFSGRGMIEEKNGKILRSPLSNTHCVYFHSIIEEHQGKRGWVIIDNLSNFVPFYITDDRGHLTVDISNLDYDLSGYDVPENITGPDPGHSEIDGTVVFKHRPFSSRVKGWMNVFGKGKMRQSEFVLKPYTEVFAHGFVSKRGNKLILHERHDHPLIISYKTKDKYIEEFYSGRNLVFMVHFLASIGFTIIMFSLNFFLHIAPSAFFYFLLFGNAAICGSVVFTLYNRLVLLIQRAKNSMSNIDIELRRRSELIPQLETIVKGYAHAEKNILNDVSGLKQKKDVAVMFEQYPELKSSERFIELSKSMVDTENRIMYSRAFYNRSVRKFNTLISQFPFLIVASLLRMKHMSYLNAGQINSQ